MPCYYSTSDCAGEPWSCRTCGEEFCQTHFHTTQLGVNVECPACEAGRTNPPVPSPDDLPEVRRLDVLIEKGVERLSIRDK